MCRPVVVVQSVSAECGDVKVGVAVVVIIANCGAHAIVVAGQASGLCHIHKRSVAQVAVQPVPIARVRFVGHFAGGHRITECRAVDKKQIQAAVIVVVEDGRATAHGFEQVLLACVISLVFEIDSSPAPRCHGR